MIVPPDLLLFTGNWPEYEETLYAEFLATFVNTEVTFRGLRVVAQFKPAYNDKGFSFWHVISEAPEKSNRDEGDRIPNIRRCERIRWIAWLIATAEHASVKWWENRRGSETRVVIWVPTHDFAVVLAERKGYYVLKTAFAEIRPHRRQTFEAEYAEFQRNQKD